MSQRRVTNEVWILGAMGRVGRAVAARLIESNIVPVLVILDQVEQNACPPQETPQEQELLTWNEAIELLDTIPGINQRAAEGILAEIGTDMTRFINAHHLASWAGMCPGSNESAGKRLSSRIRKGSPWLRTLLVEAAHAAAHSKNTYLSAQYRRLAARCGAKKAAVAVGHTILIIVYHVLQEREDYRELGGNYFDGVTGNV